MQTGVTLDNPWALALVPVLVAFIIITAKKLHFGSIFKKRMIIALRIMLVLCIAVAMASPAVKSTFNRTGTVFIADVSDSIIRSSDSMQSFVRQALDYSS